jgi:hypothetical protein
MTARPSRILTAVPQHWPVRVEIVKAIQVLAAQIKENQQRQPRTELAAISRDWELLVEALHEASRELAKAGFREISRAGQRAAATLAAAGRAVQARRLPLPRSRQPSR